MASCSYTERFIPIEQLRNKADDLKKPPKAMSPSSISIVDKDQGQVFHDSAVTVYQSSSSAHFFASQYARFQCSNPVYLSDFAE